MDFLLVQPRQWERELARAPRLSFGARDNIVNLRLRQRKR